MINNYYKKEKKVSLKAEIAELLCNSMDDNDFCASCTLKKRKPESIKIYFYKNNAENTMGMACERYGSFKENVISERVELYRTHFEKKRAWKI